MQFWHFSDPYHCNLSSVKKCDILGTPWCSTDTEIISNIILSAEVQQQVQKWKGSKCIDKNYQTADITIRGRNCCITAIIIKIVCFLKYFESIINCLIPGDPSATGCPPSSAGVCLPLGPAIGSGTALVEGVGGRSWPLGSPQPQLGSREPPSLRRSPLMLGSYRWPSSSVAARLIYFCPSFNAVPYLLHSRPLTFNISNAAACALLIGAKMYCTDQIPANCNASDPSGLHGLPGIWLLQSSLCSAHTGEICIAELAWGCLYPACPPQY